MQGPGHSSCFGWPVPTGVVRPANQRRSATDQPVDGELTCTSHPRSVAHPPTSICHTPTISSPVLTTFANPSDLLQSSSSRSCDLQNCQRLIYERLFNTLNSIVPPAPPWHSRLSSPRRPDCYLGTATLHPPSAQTSRSHTSTSTQSGRFMETVSSRDSSFYAILPRLFTSASPSGNTTAKQPKPVNKSQQKSRNTGAD